MTQLNNKIPKSFRLSPRVAEVVTKAAKDTGLSEGELVEGCIINQVDAVVERYERLKTPDAVEAVATAGRKRPREERSDKGVPKKVPSEPVLTKRQQS